MKRRKTTAIQEVVTSVWSQHATVLLLVLLIKVL